MADDDPLATMSLTDEDCEFYVALGRFVAATADAEKELRRALSHYASIQSAAGQALLHKVNFAWLIDNAARIAKNCGASQDRLDDLAFIVPHLQALNEARNLLVHGVSETVILEPPGGGRGIEDKHGEVHEFTPKQLRQMTWDLLTIGNHLNLHWSQPRWPPLPHGNDGPEDDSPWLCPTPPGSRR